jgi:hypothetical protein
VKIELLVEVDHPVAVRPDSFADLLDCLDDQPDVRPRIEDRAAPAASATTARRNSRVATASCASGAWENAAVDAIDPIPSRHRCRRALFQAHCRRFRRRDEPLRQTGRRIELDVFARFAPEQLIERHVQSFALDIP